MNSKIWKTAFIGSLSLVAILQITACQKGADKGGAASRQPKDATVKNKGGTPQSAGSDSQPAAGSAQCLSEEMLKKLKVGTELQQFTATQIQVLDQAHQMMNEMVKTGLGLKEGLSESIFSEVRKEMLTLVDETGVAKKIETQNNCGDLVKLLEPSKGDKGLSLKFSESDCDGKNKVSILEVSEITANQYDLKFNRESLTKTLGALVDRNEKEIHFMISVDSARNIISLSATKLMLQNFDLKNLEWDKSKLQQALGLIATKLLEDGTKDAALTDKKLTVPLQGKIQQMEICATASAPVSETSKVASEAGLPSESKSGDQSGSGAGKEAQSGDQSGSGAGKEAQSGDQSGSGAGKEAQSGDQSGSGSGKEAQPADQSGSEKKEDGFVVTERMRMKQ